MNYYKIEHPFGNEIKFTNNNGVQTSAINSTNLSYQESQLPSFPVSSISEISSTNNENDVFYIIFLG